MRAALALVALCACGYRFTAPGGPLPRGVRAVQAPMMSNATAEPSAEAFFTQALRELLQRAGALGGDTADARIESTLLSVSSAPMVASTGKPPSYRLTATVELRLLRGGEVLSQAQVTQEEDVLTGGTLLLTEANRQAGLRRLADAMMREGYERLCTGW